MAKPLIFVLIGPPACGKGTQALILSSKYQIPHISTGDLIRNEINQQTKRGALFFKDVNQGKFPPDELILEILYERISKPDCKGGFILDGFPRTKGQAKLLTKYAKLLRVEPFVIAIDVSDEEVIDRITNRVVCRNCSAPYHLINNPPKQEGICDYCGGPVVKRSDDSIEVIKNRLALYHEKTEPLLKFYQKQDLFFHVDGSLSKEEVTKQIDQILEKAIA